MAASIVVVYSYFVSLVIGLLTMGFVEGNVATDDTAFKFLPIIPDGMDGTYSEPFLVEIGWFPKPMIETTKLEHIVALNSDLKANSYIEMK